MNATPSVRLDALRAQLIAITTRSFDASVVAHDLQHLERVARMADAIADVEGGDRETILAAAYLHDHHRLVEKRRGRHVSPEEAEPEVIEILQQIDIDPLRRASICSAIAFTEHYRCAGDDLDALRPSIEARIVRDADMLDALGAVGIARAFMFGGHLGEPMSHPSDWSDSPVNKFVHGKTSSVVRHFHEKLLRLENEMLTSHGLQLATERSAFMRAFLAQLRLDLTS